MMRVQFPVRQYASLVGRLVRADYDKYGWRGVASLVHHVFFAFLAPTTLLALGLGGQYSKAVIPLLNVPPGSKYSTVTLYVHRPQASSAGSIDGCRRAVLMVSGVGGGVTGPGGVFVSLAKDLAKEGMTAVRLDYSAAARMPECEADVDAALTYLTSSEGVTHVAIVGWSFGGSVAIRAGLRSSAIKAVVGLAPMPHGADGVSRLHKPVLIVHGDKDTVLDVEGSRALHAQTTEPKALKIFPGDNHGLSYSRHEVHRLVFAFIQQSLLCD